MIDPPDRADIQRQVTTEMQRYDEAHGVATSGWQRFKRRRYARLLHRRLYDRHSTRHS